MEVTVKLFATLREHLPPGSNGRSCLIELEDNSNVADIIKLLNIPTRPNKIIMVNSIHADEDTVLIDNDAVAIFPPLAGG